MFCDKCGADNPNDGSFCQKCANALESGMPSGVKATGEPASPRPTGPGFIGGFAITQLLYYGALAALALAFLSGIFTVAGMENYSFSYKSGAFFSELIWGILVCGVLLGFSEIISARK